MEVVGLSRLIQGCRKTRFWLCFCLSWVTRADGSKMLSLAALWNEPHCLAKLSPLVQQSSTACQLAHEWAWKWTVYPKLCPEMTVDSLNYDFRRALLQDVTLRH